ncbi:MAG: PAS domain S-box protein, partial [Promethearchaeota archaeon]
MKWTNKKSLLISSIFIILLTICGLGSFGSSSGLTEGTFDQEIEKIFRLNEFTEDFGQLQNSLNSFSIDSIPVGWNIAEMELNFTNMEYNPLIETIEDSSDLDAYIAGASYTTVKRIAVELTIDTPRYLDAIDMKIHHVGSEFTNVFIQIQGYDEDFNRPNGTIYGIPIALNASTTEGWYLQQFSSPIFLEAGSYFIVMNGRNMGLQSAEIHWEYNSTPDAEDQYSALYWYEEPGTEYWLPSTQSRKYNHKLHFVNETDIWPEDIEMGIEVAEKEFDVTNSLLMNPNHGRSIITNIPYTQPSLQFTVYHNQPFSLSFNVAYSIKMNHTLVSNGVLQITEVQPNKWIIHPNISQEGYNHTINFEYADDWFNITISRDSSDVTNEVFFANNSLTILNSSIDSVNEWKISANSPQHIGSIETTDTSFETYDDINISLSMPLSTGELEIYILNSSSVEVYRESRNITGSKITINPVFNSSQPSGIYTLYAQYSNDTVGGLMTFIFYIHNHPQSFWEKYSGLFFIGGTFVAISMTLIVSSVAIKRYRDSSLRYRNRLEQTFQSVDEGIIVVDPDLNIRTINEKAQQMASRMNTRLIGECVSNVFKFEDKSNKNQTSNLVYHGLRSQQIKNYFGEFFLTNEGGFRTPVSITITPVKNSQGEVSEIILSFQDISQLLSAQKEFDKRHELETIGLVAAGIAHDFNNMLTAAIGSVSVAKLDEAMEEDNKELLLDAERALINATELTHQLLTVSKGGVAVQKSGNIVDIVKETVRFVLRGTKIGIDFK